MTNRFSGLFFGFLLISLLITQPADAQEKKLKIGVVRMNDVLNDSNAGKRSKNILLASKEQKEKELKSKEDQLKKLRDELDANIMLSPEARGAKEEELRRKLGELRQELQSAQLSLQSKERKLTEDIYKELKTVVEQVAKKGNFDFIVDETAAQVIVFSKYKFEDVTKLVLESYNKMSK